jgi:hypothetical protein
MTKLIFLDEEKGENRIMFKLAAQKNTVDENI